MHGIARWRLGTLLCLMLLCMSLRAHTQALGLRVLPHAGADTSFSGWRHEGPVPPLLTVPLELGDDVYGATLQLQPAQPGETWRVRVQYETSLGLSAEGPHLDLTGWKHCVSGWEAAEAVDAVSFVLPTPSAEQQRAFRPTPRQSWSRRYARTPPLRATRRWRTTGFHALARAMRWARCCRSWRSARCGCGWRCCGRANGWWYRPYRSCRRWGVETRSRARRRLCPLPHEKDTLHRAVTRSRLSCRNLLHARKDCEAPLGATANGFNKTMDSSGQAPRGSPLRSSRRVYVLQPKLKWTCGYR